MLCVGTCARICGEDAWTLKMYCLLPIKVGKFAFSISVKKRDLDFDMFTKGRIALIFLQLAETYSCYGSG